MECSLISTEAGAMNLLPTNCTKFPESNEVDDNDDFDKKKITIWKFCNIIRQRKRSDGVLLVEASW